MNHPWLAALWMSGAMASFSLMAVAGRELSSTLDTFEIMTYRSLIGIVIVVAVALATGQLGRVSTALLWLHGLRNISHFIGQNLWFFAVALIPMAQLFAFEFSTPIWVALLAPVFLGERMTLTRIAVAVIGFGGIVIIVQPGDVQITKGVLAAAACAIGFAGSVMSTKVLSRSQPIVSIMFWMVAMQAVFGLAMAGFDGDIALPRGIEAAWVTVIACCGLGAHFCVTTALSLAPASVVSPMDFLRLPLISVVALLLYDEPMLKPVFIGAGVVVLANLINLHAEHRRSRAVA